MTSDKVTTQKNMTYTFSYGAFNYHVQVRKSKKYKFKDPKVRLSIVIDLICSKNYNKKTDFGVLGFVLLQLFNCKEIAEWSFSPQYLKK